MKDIIKPVADVMVYKYPGITIKEYTDTEMVVLETEDQDGSVVLETVYSEDSKAMNGVSISAVSTNPSSDGVFLTFNQLQILFIHYSKNAENREHGIFITRNP